LVVVCDARKIGSGAILFDLESKLVVTQAGGAQLQCGALRSANRTPTPFPLLA
jgi:hypothetical protein